MAQYSNPYYVEPANLNLGLDKALEGMLKGAEIKQVRQQSADDKKAMSDFADNFENMSPVEVGKYVLNNPRVGKFITDAVDTTSKMTNQEKLADAVEVARAYITGNQGVQEKPVQPTVQPVQPPAEMQPSVGLDFAPVSPVGQPSVAPVGQETIPQQDGAQAPSGKDQAVKVLTGHVQENLQRGGNSTEGIELVRDAMTGGEKAFKGAMATIAALDPQTFDRLMELQGGDAELPTTDISRYANEEIRKWERDNPEAVARGEEAPPELIQAAMREIKRPQAIETSEVAEARKTAELEVIKQMQPGIERDKAIVVYQAKAEEKRSQEAINKGLVAAEAMPNLKRGIDLLDKVVTGGYESVKLNAARFFGVEGADEGELSNRLAKAVLSQLRDTFGAAFTVGEGDKLDRIEAGFSKSPENNKRLLSQALLLSQGKVDTALRIAKAKGDQNAVDQIQGWLDFDLGAGGAPTPEVSTKAEYDTLAPGAFYMEDGKKYQKPGGQ